MDEHYTWDIGSVWHKQWPETMYAVIYISWSSDFALYLLDFFSNFELFTYFCL